HEPRAQLPEKAACDRRLEVALDLWHRQLELWRPLRPDAGRASVSADRADRADAANAADAAIAITGRGRAVPAEPEAVEIPGMAEHVLQQPASLLCCARHV